MGRKPYWQQKEVVLHDAVRGRGDTKKEAKADAIRRIQEAFAVEHDYTPIVLAIGHHQALVYRSLNGWSYGWLKPNETGAVANLRGWHQDKYDVRDSAAYHLAQLAWDGTNDDECLAIQGDGRHEDLRDWFAWQRRFEVFIAEGYDSTQAHALACGFKTREDFPTPIVT